MNSLEKRLAIQSGVGMPTSVMTSEEIDELNLRVGVALNLRRRINIATGLTAVPVESEDQDVLVFNLQAIAGFNIATVHCSWVPATKKTEGYWRMGRLMSFDMADLRAAIDQ